MTANRTAMMKAFVAEKITVQRRFRFCYLLIILIVLLPFNSKVEGSEAQMEDEDGMEEDSTATASFDEPHHEVQIEKKDHYHFAMISGTSPYYFPINDGWHDECIAMMSPERVAQTGTNVTCEFYNQSKTQEMPYLPGLYYNKTEDERTCVAYIRYILERNHNVTLNPNLGYRRVDGIGVKCVVDETGPPIIQQAYDANVPIVAFAGPHVGPYVTYVGTSNYESGIRLAQLLKQLRPEGGTYVTVYNGPPAKSRALGFEYEIEKDNDREDRAHWTLEPTLDLELLGWNNSEFRGGVGDEKLYDILSAESPPTAIAFCYSTPLRKTNYSTNVDAHRNKNITYIGLEGASRELELMTHGYIDGLVGEQTYKTGRLIAQALYDYVVLGQRPLDSTKYETQVINYNLVPKDLPKLEVDQNLLGNLKYAGYICFATIAAGVIICIGWTIAYRNGTVVKASQPFFLVMTATGVLIMAASLIPLSMDDDGKTAEDLNETYAIGICMSIPWLAFSGFTICFSALFAKTWRINQFFKSKSSHARIRVSTRDVLGLFLVTFGLNTIVLVCWTVLDPYVLVYDRTYVAGTDLFNRDLATVGLCRSEDGSVIYLVVLGICNLTLLTMAGWQALASRSIQSEFSEAKYIGLTIFSLFQGVLTGIPIAAVVKDLPRPFYLIMTFLVFCLCMAVLLLIFLPKIHLHWEYSKMTPAEQKKAMQVSVRLSTGTSSQFRSLRLAQNQPISGLLSVRGFTPKTKANVDTKDNNEAPDPVKENPLSGTGRSNSLTKEGQSLKKNTSTTVERTERGYEPSADNGDSEDLGLDSQEKRSSHPIEESGEFNDFIRQLNDVGEGGSPQRVIYSSYLDGDVVDA